MPPTDKTMPELLTKRELQGLRDNWHRIAYGDAALNTIEAFAELLAWTVERLDGYCNEPKCRCREAKALLAAYRGTGTSEQEGGGA